MRSDEAGFFYFIDRIGDTFRWKGENVATTEVAAAITAFPGVKDANVCGVRTGPRRRRRTGSAIVTVGTLDLAEFRNHPARQSPAYARPLFLRITQRLAATATFKHTKSDMQREGFDPTATSDPIYFDDPASKAFIRLDGPFYAGLANGKVRL